VPQEDNIAPLPGHEARARPLALLVALMVGALLLPDARDFALDDAWIHLSYAKSLRAGDGLSYNPGDWETGFSSPLWVLLLSMWPTGTSPVLPVKLLGLLLHGLSAWLAAQLGLEIGGRRATLAEPLPLLSIGLLAGVLVATAPPLVEGATSGMEVPLATATLLGCAWAVISGRVGAAAALGVAAVWSRPECLPWLLVFGTILGIARRRDPQLPARRAPWAAVAGGLAAMAAWSGWCLAVSGRPWPNTQTIKGAGGGLDGLSYLAERVLPWQPWLVGLTGVALLAVALRDDARRRRPELWALVTASWVTWVAIAVTRPLHEGALFYESRYFAPLVAPLLLALPFGLPRRPRWAAPALVAPIAILTGLQLADIRTVVLAHEEDTAALHTKVARWIAAELPPDAVVAVEGAGAIRYFAPRSMTVVDLVGLNDGEAALRHFDRRAKLCHFVHRHPTHFAMPSTWAGLFAPVFRLQPLVRFSDDHYTQVDPPHPQDVVVFAVVAVNPEWEGCDPSVR
jgi:hypothetical protein